MVIELASLTPCDLSCWKGWDRAAIIVVRAQRCHLHFTLCRWWTALHGRAHDDLLGLKIDRVEEVLDGALARGTWPPALAALLNATNLLRNLPLTIPMRIDCILAIDDLFALSSDQSGRCAIMAALTHHVLLLGHLLDIHCVAVLL